MLSSFLTIKAPRSSQSCCHRPFLIGLPCEVINLQVPYFSAISDSEEDIAEDILEKGVDEAEDENGIKG